MVLMRGVMAAARREFPVDCTKAKWKRLSAVKVLLKALGTCEFFQLLTDVVEEGHMVLGALAGRQRRHLRLQDRPRLHDLKTAGLAFQKEEGLEGHGFRGVFHEIPQAGPGFDEADGGEGGEGLPHGGPAHPHHLGELRLRGELGLHGKDALLDGPEELLGHLGGGLGWPDLAELHGVVYLSDNMVALAIHPVNSERGAA
jgi:hypothetical protein